MLGTDDKGCLLPGSEIDLLSEVHSACDQL